MALPSHTYAIGSFVDLDAGSTLASSLCKRVALSVLTGMPSAVARENGIGPSG